MFHEEVENTTHWKHTFDTYGVYVTKKSEKTRSVNSLNDEVLMVTGEERVVLKITSNPAVYAIVPWGYVLE